MPTMKRCLAQLSTSGRWGTEHFFAGLEVDFDRVLAPEVKAVDAVGVEGSDGYVPARPAVPAFTVRDSVAGREECFEDVAPAEAAATDVRATRHIKQQPAAMTPREE
jgi:hypothetical protein